MNEMNLPEERVLAAIEHMNQDHQKNLVAYARVLADAAWAQSATLTAVDTHGFDLLVTDGNGRQETRRLEFLQPVQDAGQLRHAFIRLAEQADPPDGSQRVATAHVETGKASRYLKALCNHFDRKVTASYDDANEGNKRNRVAAKNAISSGYFTLFIVLVLLLGITACSSGSGETAVTPAPTNAPAEPTAEPVAEPTAEPTAEEAIEETAEASASPLPRTITDIEGNEVVIEDDSRIIALEGPVTEIVYALGAGDHLVATDTSSVYPEAARQLPQVGYVRQLSAEPILAVDPSLIITTDQAGPPEAVAQLRESGVPIAMFAAASSVAESYALIRSIAQTLGLEAKGEELIAQMEADLAEAEALLAQVESTPRVLFIYARGVDTVMGGGLDTGVDVILAMAGAENAITEFEGYQPLTAEAAVTAAPDAYLLFTSGLASVGGADGLLQIPGLAQTPAAENGQVFAMDGLLLTGFGPRVGQAVLELIHLLHPEVE